MAVREINFDGIVGPSHNYAGLSPGNLASAHNAGAVSNPRAAALQGLAKMRANLDLGLAQGIFVPLARPDGDWLAELAIDGKKQETGEAAEYPSLYAEFAELIAAGRSHVDLEPLRVVADAFMLATREAVEPFED